MSFILVMMLVLGNGNSIEKQFGPYSSQEECDKQKDIMIEEFEKNKKYTEVDGMCIDEGDTTEEVKLYNADGTEIK